MDQQQLRQDLDETMAAVRSIDGAMHYMSQRVAWSETCFQQVQSSGVIHMADLVRKVSEDHKKLISQVNMLSMRIAAMQNQGGDGESGGTLPRTTVKPSMNRFGS